MRCARIDELLPLYAGGDLDAETGLEVSRHLADCPECRRSADAFAESHEMLGLLRAPEFEPEFYDGVRAAVLDEIGRRAVPAPARPLARPWLWPLALAACLVLVSTSVFLLMMEYAERLETSLTVPGNIDWPPRPHVPGPVDVGPGPQKPKPLPRGNRPARRKPARPAVRTVLPESIRAGLTVPPRGITKIEYQTADPNVRVIWFVSGPTAHEAQAKPAGTGV